MAKIVESNLFLQCQKTRTIVKTRIYFSHASQTRWCHYLYNRTFINRKVCENQGKYILELNEIVLNNSPEHMQPNINLTVEQLQVLKLQLLDNR